jgi:O-antigen/teichoic acid export membrane protein
MSKALEMARVSAKGGFHVLWGLVASTVISAVGTIIIINLLGSDNYGLYNVALAAPNLISVFRDWGINTAMIKFAAEYRSENNVAKVKSVLVSGLVFELALGVLLSFLSFALSGLLASSLNRPTIVPLIQIASFFVLTGALVNTATAAFTGMETMHLNSIMLVVQSIIKTGLMIGLVLVGLGTLGAVTGFTTGVLFAGLTGLLLIWTVYRSLPETTNIKLELLANTKNMLKYGLPVSIGAILAGFLTQFYTYALGIYVPNNSLIGAYGTAVTFQVLITFFASPVTTMMFPAFSKLDYQKDKELLRNIFQYSVKYAALIVVPVTWMVIVLARPAIETLFHDKSVIANSPLYLALLSAVYLYSALGSLSTGNLIAGQGYTKYLAKLYGLTALIGFPLSWFMISNFGVLGLIITTLIVGLPTLILGLRFIKNKFEVTLDWVSSAKILFSSTIAAVLTYVLISLIALPSPIKLVIGIIVFLVVAIFVALVTRTLNKADIISLREIVKMFGPLRWPLTVLLNFAERFLKRIGAYN